MSRIKDLIVKVKEYTGQLWEKGAFHIMAGNFATKFVTFFGSVFLSRALSKEDLGILTYMENLCSYAYIFVGVGMANAILRYNVLSKAPEEKKAFLAFALKRGIFFDILLIFIVVAVNAIYPHKEDFIVAKSLIPILIMALPLQDVIGQIQMNERAMFNNKRYAIFSVTSAAFIIVARVSGAKICGLKGVVIGIVIINVIIAIFFVASSYKKYFEGVKTRCVSKEIKKESSLYGLQYMITNGLWGIFMLMDIFLLGNLLGDATIVADYKIAYSFPVNMSIFSGAIGVFVAPYFIKNEKNEEWIRTNYIKTMIVTIGIMGCVAVGLFVLARPLIWLYGEKYYNVIPLMRVLIISCFIDTVFRSTTANILSAIGKIKHNMIISGCGFILQVCLNFFMIPMFGAYGVAYTSIIVQVIMSISVFAVFNKMYDIVSFVKNRMG